MKFGFMANPASMAEVKMLRVLKQLNTIPFDKIIEGDLSSAHPDGVTDSRETIALIDSLTITSATGASATGKVLFVPLLPEEITLQQDRALQMIINAARELEDWGADIIGLGAYTAVVGGRGREVQNALTKATVTTGNSYTTYSSIETTEYILKKLNLNLADIQTVVVGFPGSISLAATKMLARRGARLLVVGRQDNLVMKRFLDDLEPELQDRIEFCMQLKEGVQRADLLLTATSTGGIIDQDWLKPGAIVVDIAEPKDVIRREQNRDDVLVVDGGRFNFSAGVQIEGAFSSILRTGFFGCIGETMLLALDNMKVNLSLGRILEVERIEQIGRIAATHGFQVTDLHQWGRPVDEGVLRQISKILNRAQIKDRIPLHTFDSVLNSTKEQTWERYRDHINPTLADISEIGDFDRTYVRAEGIHVWDTNGRKYYDFVGGYGSVNVGHNHPRMIETIRRFAEESLPTLLQVSPGIFPAALADNLAELAPGNLEMTFFCNSGTEANEGALKMARIYTHRDKIVSTHNSFHGKTYGSLSVTGRAKYQKYFQPLLPGCSFVQFGNLEELNEALSGGDVAAFIVEPIQGEGGVIVPPAGYLRQAKELCQQYGTLMIVDEIQTGFGRTGKLFAVEHEGVVPDILTLAKSLGGGLVPIGAYMTTKDIWEKAYGTQERYLLHTSTFGGNNFCSAVALTTLDVIVNEGLIANAADVGAYFYNKLQLLAEKYQVIKEVRGRGLMLGIEFTQPMDGGIERMKEMILAMVPSQYKSMLSVLPGSIVERFKEFIKDCQVDLEKTLEDNFVTQIAAKLLNRFGILSIVTLNNPNVMRIQPALLLTKEDADCFVHALDAICSELSLLDKETLD